MPIVCRESQPFDGFNFIDLHSNAILVAQRKLVLSLRVARVALFCSFGKPVVFLNYRRLDFAIDRNRNQENTLRDLFF